MALPPPATGVEMYLAAVLDELRAIRVAVEGGAPAPPAAGPAVPTKRTRTRPRE